MSNNDINNKEIEAIKAAEPYNKAPTIATFYP